MVTNYHEAISGHTASIPSDFVPVDVPSPLDFDALFFEDRYELIQFAVRCLEDIFGVWVMGLEFMEEFLVHYRVSDFFVLVGEYRALGTPDDN